MSLSKIKNKSLKTYRLSVDGRVLTGQDLIGETFKIEVDSFVNYQGQNLLVESIDRETKVLTCLDSDGASYEVEVSRLDAVNV